MDFEHYCENEAYLDSENIRLKTTYATWLVFYPICKDFYNFERVSCARRSVQ
jgi:hypothetical protein